MDREGPSRMREDDAISSQAWATKTFRGVTYVALLFFPLSAKPSFIRHYFLVIKYVIVNAPRIQIISATVMDWRGGEASC